MKRIAVSTLIVIVGLGFTLVAAPKIQVDQPVYDFDEVLEGSPVTGTFVLSNLGDEMLTISRVWASCGCTTTALAKTSLAPGESVTLKAIVDTAGFGGAISKSVYVESNDPEISRLTLRIIGSVAQGEKMQKYHMSVDNLNYLFYVLIDLRDPQDFATGHLLGAINVPLAELEDWINPLPRETFIILYDQDGSLSDEAAQNLNGSGFPNAWSLFGGLNEWMRRLDDRFLLSTTAE
ncbi:TPA: hypothetical protein DIT45_03175 [Candidatus Acetothermia bacterium]|nr:hypothetical protein [Candidatus Acetothermia bacterium]